MPAATPPRSATVHRALRCAVVLACLGMAAAIALLVLRAWWPAVYLGLLPSPQAVIAELHAIGGVASSDPSDYRSGALAALEDRFPHAADEAALLAALAAGPPDGALADLAREWTERHPASTDAVLAAVLRHRDASAAADRALVRAAYLSISHASLPGWLRKHQEADGCWPAATAPPGPGRWRPDRAASTAFAMMALMDEGADNITPGRMKKVLQEAVAALRARQRPDGRCADDARDHAAITLALVQLYAMTSEATLRSAAQGAVTAARRDLTAGGDCAWERDTTLALLQLVALKVAADARLDVGAALDDPYRALRACWAVENPTPGAPVRFRWREDGVALVQGEPDGVAGALMGFFTASVCRGHGGSAPELELLAGRVSAASADPRAWTPLGLSWALCGISALPVPAGTPPRKWLESAVDGLVAAITVGDREWDGAWGSSADPRDVAANAVLGSAALAALRCLGDRRFWEHEAAHPTR